MGMESTTIRVLTFNIDEIVDMKENKENVFRYVWEEN